MSIHYPHMEEPDAAELAEEQDIMDRQERARIARLVRLEGNSACPGDYRCQCLED